MGAPTRTWLLFCFALVAAVGGGFVCIIAFFQGYYALSLLGFLSLATGGYIAYTIWDSIKGNDN